ncbi:DUF2939 domain-containing protein [Idiomarina sp. Sol25]|uniref:DUF2939 domain-containing protein n=1 Tax=Idiomarina sp. Sol25 TaxID=3064000 RepID=UPI003981B4DC
MPKKWRKTRKCEITPFAALGAALASAMVDKIVDVYVTPAGIRQLMASKLNLSCAAKV